MNMKKTISIIALAVLSCGVSYAESASQVYIDAPEDLPVADIWRDSWRVGSQYEHIASFTINADVQFKTDDEAPFYRKIFNRVTIDDIGNKILLMGDARAFTSVLANDSKKLVLYRTYATTTLQPNFYFDTEKPLMVNLFLRKIFEDGKVRGFVDEWTQEIVSWIPEKFLEKGTGYCLKTLKLGEKAEKGLRRSVESFGLEEATAEDGQRIYRVKDKSVAQKYFGSFVDKVNAALSLNEAFSSKNYLIVNDRKDGISVKRITEENAKIVDELAGGGITDSETEIMKNLSAPKSKEAEPTFRREAWAINEKIFGGEKRRKGDVWSTGAEFLNSFLHSDLKGRFEGRVVLKYVADTEVVIERPGWATPFKARKIELLESAGSLETDARYVETDENGNEKFSLSLNGRDACLEIYMDCESLLVRKVFLNAVRNSVKEGNLPDTIWTRDLSLTGTLDCQMNYYCRGRAAKK